MRARNIKPGFFKNDELAECTFEARLLFIGLWCAADREGRIEDRPKRLKGELFPFDNCDVDSMLDELAGRGFIARYTVGESRFIQIPKFSIHQRPHQNEIASTIPPPDESIAAKVQSTSHQGSTHFALNPSSLNPDSLLPPPGGVGGETKTKTKTRTKPEPDGFELFWSAYPKKVARGAALKAWSRLNPNATLQSAFLSALDWQKRSDMWRKAGGQYIPNAATWLNNEHWTDQPMNGSANANVDAGLEQSRRDQAEDDRRRAALRKGVATK